MTVDQPLHGPAKENQWSKPDVLGGDTFLILMEDLHNEMTFEKCLGMKAIC